MCAGLDYADLSSGNALLRWGLEHARDGWTATEKESSEKTSKTPPLIKHLQLRFAHSFCQRGRWTMERGRGIFVTQAALGGNNGHYGLL